MFPSACFFCHQLEVVFGDLAAAVLAFQCSVSPFNVVLGRLKCVSVVVRDLPPAVDFIFMRFPGAVLLWNRTALVAKRISWLLLAMASFLDRPQADQDPTIADVCVVDCDIAMSNS